MCCIYTRCITDKSQEHMLNMRGSQLIKLSAPIIVHESNTDHANLTDIHSDRPQTQHEVTVHY